jgi:putative redox protein
LKATASWVGGMRFLCDADRGHAIVMEPQPEGGPGSAPSPVEMLLASLAACTGTDVVSILTRMRTPPRSLTVTAEGERAQSHPRVFTHIHLTYRVAGPVPPEKLERAINLSESTYCSIGAMLGKVTKITHEQILEP